MQRSIYSLSAHAFFIGIVFSCFCLAPVEADQLKEKINKQILNANQRKEIKSIIGKYLMDNPEIILKSVKSMQERRNTQKRKTEIQKLQTYRELILYDPTSPVGGNLNGDISVIEFFDYSCGYCKKVFPIIKTILHKDKNIRFVYKEFPILSPQSELAARAALATWRQNKTKYIQIHSEFNNLKGAFTESRIFRIAKKLGLNLAQLRKDMQSKSMDKTILNNRQLARNIGISGTPGFIIGDKIIRGAVDLTTLEELVSHARNK